MVVDFRDCQRAARDKRAGAKERFVNRRPLRTTFGPRSNDAVLRDNRTRTRRGIGRNGAAWETRVSAVGGVVVRRADRDRHGEREATADGPALLAEYRSVERGIKSGGLVEIEHLVGARGKPGVEDGVARSGA